MLRIFKTRINPYVVAYNSKPDSMMIPTRKSVIAEVEDRKVLIYAKAMVSEVKIGSQSIVEGFIVSEVVKTNGYDGLVVCIKA